MNMDDLPNIAVKRGQVVPLTYEGRNFEVVVIDPNGLGKGQPSIGFGFNGMEDHAGLPQPTLSQWLEDDSNNQEKSLKLPSGNTFRVIQIIRLDNNRPTLVIEASDWVTLVVDVLKKPGKIRKPTKNKLLDFLGWFAVKGFYADAYVVLKGAYTRKDSRSVSAWLEARLSGIPRRNKYTDFLQEQGCFGYDYARWTNYVYMGLFNMYKKEMTEVWELVEGDRSIGRNYIPKAEGLNAVAYCENQVIELFHQDLQQAHDDAIAFAKRKFNLDFE